MQKSIVYFQDPGEQNTAQVIQAAKERAIELDIKEIVVASTSGKTGVAMANALKGTEIRTIAATHHYGSHEKGNVMAGRFGKYGDIKRKANIRRSERFKKKISMPKTSEAAFAQEAQ